MVHPFANLTQFLTAGKLLPVPWRQLASYFAVAVVDRQAVVVAAVDC